MSEENELLDTVKALEDAKQAVRDCLSNEGVLVDLHGLAYWAGEVERLRNKVKGLI